MTELVNKFRKWLTKIKGSNKDSNNKNILNASEINSKNKNQSKTIFNNFSVKDFEKSNRVKVFENESIVMYVEKTIHKRLKNFKLLDNVFQVKIETKNNEVPTLKDLLKTFSDVFNFVLTDIKNIFDPNDHNIAYLTLFQEPMVNGINTGFKL